MQRVSFNEKPICFPLRVVFLSTLVFLFLCVAAALFLFFLPHCRHAILFGHFDDVQLDWALGDISIFFYVFWHQFRQIQCF